MVTDVISNDEYCSNAKFAIMPLNLGIFKTLKCR